MGKYKITVLKLGFKESLAQKNLAGQGLRNGGDENCDENNWKHAFLVLAQLTDSMIHYYQACG